MWTRKLLLSAIVASTFAAVASAAQARVEIFVSVPPPPMRHEAVPAPRAGYIWTPGYWNWQSNRHVWARGHWERGRTGYYYHPNRWTQPPGWYNRPGRWDRHAPSGDRDRDGIPNAADRDRDGDGIRNHNDRRPDDPRKY